MSVKVEITIGPLRQKAKAEARRPHVHAIFMATDKGLAISSPYGEDHIGWFYIEVSKASYTQLLDALIQHHEVRKLMAPGLPEQALKEADKRHQAECARYRG